MSDPERDRDWHERMATLRGRMGALRDALAMVGSVGRTTLLNAKTLPNEIATAIGKAKMAELKEMERWFTQSMEEVETELRLMDSEP